MGHVFISYAREDREYAAHLAGLLEDAGLSVWLDDRIQPGKHYDDIIEKALDDAEQVIVIWSAASVRSQWVRAEAGEGLRRGVLVPIAIDDSKIPLKFRRVQALDFSAWCKTADESPFRSLARHLQSAASKRIQVADGSFNPARIPIRASLVSADRVNKNLRIRLRVGDHSHRLEHSKHGVRQVVKLDGKIVAKGGSLFSFEDYFLLEDAVPYTKRIELFLRGDFVFGVERVILSVDGQEVLDESSSTWRGIALIIVSIVLFALALEGLLWMLGLTELG